MPENVLYMYHKNFRVQGVILKHSLMGKPSNKVTDVCPPTCSNMLPLCAITKQPWIWTGLSWTTAPDWMNGLFLLQLECVPLPHKGASVLQTLWRKSWREPRARCLRRLAWGRKRNDRLIPEIINKPGAAAAFSITRHFNVSRCLRQTRMYLSNSVTLQPDYVSSESKKRFRHKVEKHFVLVLRLLPRDAKNA